MKRSEMIEEMYKVPIRAFNRGKSHRESIEAILAKQEELGMLPPNGKDKYDGSIFQWDEE